MKTLKHTKITFQMQGIGSAVEEDLNPKQKLFMEEFLVDLNATKAAIRAGYSKRSARQIGAENLSKPSIQIAIRARMQNRVKDLRVKQQWVVDELVKQYHKSTNSDEDNIAAVRCLELIGKHLGMFKGEGQETKAHGKVVILPSNGRAA